MSTANVAGAAVETRHWIGGRRVASAAVFTDLSPIDEQPLAEIARGGEAEAAAAVQAAREAFAGWAQTPPPGRTAVLHAIADGIGPRGAELPRSRRPTTARCAAAPASVMPRAAHNFRFFADWLGELTGEEIRGHREVSGPVRGTRSSPRGTPADAGHRRIAPALAAGNTV
jgi:5-carboxymethyl-2-hydroxymuconic-semialdehyde dehydrogenase